MDDTESTTAGTTTAESTTAESTSPGGTVVAPGARPRTGGVQSVERAFGLLEVMADAGGLVGLSRLAEDSGLPLPTIHRLVRTLVDLGYVRQEPSRQYVLGPRLIRLGESSSRMLSVWARPHLETLAEALGESANLALLDGDEVVYVAQAQSGRSMRMFTEVGRRVLPHCTAVGKAVMAGLPRAEVREILGRTGMPRYTPTTIADVAGFEQALDVIAERGYALDEGEQEDGVRCVAVPLPEAPARLAISVSGPVSRMTDDVVARAVPLLHDVGADLTRDLR